MAFIDNVILWVNQLILGNPRRSAKDLLNILNVPAEVLKTEYIVYIDVVETKLVVPTTVSAPTSSTDSDAASVGEGLEAVQSRRDPARRIGGRRRSNRRRRH